MVTDPDYLNVKIIEYIEAQKLTVHRKAFDHASSFEDFLKMIQKSTDLEELKAIRFAFINTNFILL